MDMLTLSKIFSATDIRIVFLIETQNKDVRFLISALVRSSLCFSNTFRPRCSYDLIKNIYINMKNTLGYSSTFLKKSIFGLWSHALHQQLAKNGEKK